MRKLLLLLPLMALGLALTACGAPPPPPLAALPQAPRNPFPRGIDMALDSRDVSSEIRGSGLDFVARYYRDPASRFPTLSASEAAALSSAGFNIVVVWEWHSHKREYFSYASGYADAMSSYRQAKSIGQPTGSAIYFAVDYNADANDIPGPIDQYFRGIAAGFAAAGGANEYKVGVYGSGSVCSYLKSRRLAQYAWLSNSIAWSGYDSFRNWNIKQSRGTWSLTFDHDLNEAATSDYGGFQVKNQYSSL